MAEKKALNPAALTLQEAAKMLGLRREWLEADIAAGAPTGVGGAINLVHYGAWLNLAQREGADPPSPKATEDNSGEA